MKNDNRLGRYSTSIVRSDVYDPCMPDMEIIHRGNHKVRVIPLNWVNRGDGSVTITKAMAHCTNCGWDTPILFSMDRARTVADRHVTENQRYGHGKMI